MSDTVGRATRDLVLLVMGDVGDLLKVFVVGLGVQGCGTQENLKAALC